MTVVFNSNSPKPRYVLIWDIKQVLTFIRGMPNNTEVSDRNINFKLVVLLFFTFFVGQSHKICYLNIRFMVRTSSSFNFFLPKLQKVAGKGNLHHVWSFISILMIKYCVQWLVFMNTQENLPLDVLKLKTNFFQKSRVLPQVIE